jgi:hypothetical protein
VARSLRDGLTASSLTAGAVSGLEGGDEVTELGVVVGEE